MGIVDESSSLLCLSRIEGTESLLAKLASTGSTFLPFIWKNPDCQGSNIGKLLLALMAQRQWLSMMSVG